MSIAKIAALLLAFWALVGVIDQANTNSRPPEHEQL
jgi:hypothetical protein